MGQFTHKGTVSQVVTLSTKEGQEPTTNGKADVMEKLKLPIYRSPGHMCPHYAGPVVICLIEISVDETKEAWIPLLWNGFNWLVKQPGRTPNWNARKPGLVICVLQDSSKNEFN